MHAAAQVCFQSKLSEHGSLNAAGTLGLSGIRSIDHLDVIGFVPRHHLVARDGCNKQNYFFPPAWLGAERSAKDGSVKA